MTHRTAQAVDQLRHAYDQLVSIEELARELDMSLSIFYQHVKAVTALSPLLARPRR